MRAPVRAPSAASTWEDELWRLEKLYGANALFTLGERPDGERVLQLTHHCTDPDWEAVNWAPEGLFLEVRVPAAYPAPGSSPALRVIGPDGLPERFAQLVPCLFAESVSTAPPDTAAVYRALQYVDRLLAALWLKVRAAADRAEAERLQAARAEAERAEMERSRQEAARKRSATWSDEDQKLLEAALEEFRDEADFKRRWSLIAQRVGGGHSARACAERYRVCRDFALGRIERLEVADASPADAPTDAVASVTLWSAEHVRRQGIEVRLIGLTLEGFATLLLDTLRLQVVCGRCKKPSDIASEGGGAQVRTHEAPCPVCNQRLGVRVAPAICHGGCSAVAHVLGMNCHPTQFLRSDFLATCGECTGAIHIQNAGPGYRKRGECPACFGKVNIAIEGDELLGPGVAHWRQVAAQESERMSARQLLKDARKQEKEQGVRAGQPLPNNGACKHYQKSFRWLRFPCCGRAFPCVECHDEQTDHPHAWADRMLCGSCSHEAPYSKDKCSRCGATQTRPRSAFWEGGDGCRNSATMSKNDRHKYKGMGKTVPRGAAKRGSK